MVLFRSINNEYIDEDLLANKEVIKRQFKHVTTASDKYLPASQLDQNMMYNFDKLFEDFRSAVEGILSADFEDSLTLTKSYEIIKKYNYIASYLKNIVKLSSLNERDITLIQDKFKSMIPNLQNLYNVAVSKNFIDVGEIEAMLESIKNQMFHTVDSNVKNNIDSRVKDRNDTLSKVKEASTELQRLRDMIAIDPDLQNDANFMQGVSKLETFFNDPDIKQMFKTTTGDSAIDTEYRKKFITNIKEHFGKIEELKGKPEIIKALRRLYDIDEKTQHMIAEVEANLYDASGDPVLTQVEFDEVTEAKERFEQFHDYLHDPANVDTITKMNINEIKKMIHDLEPQNDEIKQILDYILFQRKHQLHPAVVTSVPKKGIVKLPPSAAVNVKPPMYSNPSSFAKEWGVNMGIDFKQAQQNAQQKKDWQVYKTNPGSYIFQKPIKGKKK